MKTENQISTADESIRINNQTVGNLKKYLDDFPDDAKVVIHHNCIVYDTQICCNFQNQKETKTAQLMLGFIIESEG